MPALYLLRHADAAAPPAGQTDRERRLSDRGVTQCRAIVAHIGDNDIDPDLVLCSTAERARQTLSRVMEAWDRTVAAEYLDSLYEAHPEEIRAAIASRAHRYTSIMVVGHNPGLQMLALGLCSNRSGRACLETATGFPPGALAKMETAPAAWEHAEPGTFTYLKLLKP